ncbi:MAG TPA: Ig-like domain repeat protein [Bryobacteraceae bacterium]
MRQHLFCVALLALVSTGVSFAEDDTTPPELKALRISPAEIQTSAGPAEVTLNFTITDDASGANYFEAVFTDPSGGERRSASGKFNPTRSLTESAKITFPRFSNGGEWELSRVFISDAAGNTLSLDTDALRRGGFPTQLQVKSAKDTVSPKLTALSFAPPEVDTSKGPGVVKVNFTATDDLSGVNYLELSFASPSGTFKTVSTKFEPAGSFSNSLDVTFPARSEPGQWTLNTVFVADAAGNTLVLSAEGLAALGFRTTLEVKSAWPDTRSPELASVRFSPEAIDTSQGEAVVTVEFKASADVSGVKSFEVVFASPSGVMSPKGLATFSPASKEVSGSVKITFPKSSEQGAWTLLTLILSDEAGNTLVLGADVLASKAGVLQVR